MARRLIENMHVTSQIGSRPYWRLSFVSIICVSAQIEKMVVKCSIIGCSNRKDREKELQYYRLPAIIKNQGAQCEQLSSDRRRVWLANIGQSFENKNVDNVRVCSAHFVSGEKSELYDHNNPGWAPTVMLRAMSDEVKSTDTGRYKRRKNRHQKCEAHSWTDVLSSDVNSRDEQSSGVECQTEITSSLFEAMDNEIKALRIENQQLKKEAVAFSERFSLQSFEENEEKVKHLTGLQSYEILFSLFMYLQCYLPCRTSIDKFAMLILTLMRLRLNMSVLFLSYIFGVSQATVSRILSSVIDVMYVRMQPFVLWPDREQLQKTMPMQFRKHFGTKCAVIIDCFEVFIERPSNLVARAETWSSYKHHNTVKFLIGITPQGTVSFISNAWGGRVSDKFITENSGLLDKLLPGDLILADRGFDIRESVSSVYAKINIPAFTKGKDQLSAVDVETTRKLANVRIHVERVIGMVRQKYTILNGTLPINLLMSKDDQGIKMVNKIGLVCCGLVNLCNSVVDFD